MPVRVNTGDWIGVAAGMSSGRLVAVGPPTLGVGLAVVIGDGALAHGVAELVGTGTAVDVAVAVAVGV